MGQQRNVGVDLVVVEVGHALVERRDFCQHPLDPAFDEFRLHPVGPSGVADLAISHREVRVAHQHGGIADGGRWRTTDQNRIRKGAVGFDPVTGVSRDVHGVARSRDRDRGNAAIAVTRLGDRKARDHAAAQRRCGGCGATTGGHAEGDDRC